MKFQATVELGGSHTRGMMVLEKRNRSDIIKPSHNVDVVELIEENRLKKMLMRAFGHQIPE